MKSTVIAPAPIVVKRSFPCLMISKNNCIIMATGADTNGRDLTGICVNKGISNSILGEHSYSWSTTSFELYEGKVTLEN